MGLDLLVGASSISHYATIGQSASTAWLAAQACWQALWETKSQPGIVPQLNGGCQSSGRPKIFCGTHGFLRFDSAEFLLLDACSGKAAHEESCSDSGEVSDEAGSASDEASEAGVLILDSPPRAFVMGKLLAEGALWRALQQNAAKIPKNREEAASAEAVLLKAAAPHNNSVAVEFMVRVLSNL